MDSATPNHEEHHSKIRFTVIIDETNNPLTPAGMIQVESTSLSYCLNVLNELHTKDSITAIIEQNLLSTKYIDTISKSLIPQNLSLYTHEFNKEYNPPRQFAYFIENEDGEQLSFIITTKTGYSARQLFQQVTTPVQLERIKHAHI